MKPFDFIEHPEGGRFLEVFRSAKLVTSSNGTTRSALTHIYFSLRPGEVSMFHKVTSDEVWNLYQGAGLILHTWDGTKTPPVRTVLSAKNNCFCRVVPAGMWQAAEPITDTVLVGCSVAPGFEFSDFTLINPESKEAQRLISTAPGLTRFIVSDKTEDCRL
ncbi:cupin domain-containing protein [Desulforhopalus sp. IMCC35007]|uniref:cupin domain-containing protein n=1 Tax=Desulforhopalus sp. IMCC35007 TaxID=2569543 RepID=UPI0010AE2B0C|nr:cupin domain-containing protein [Desulforhopalus sp. IMCC35007]TKB05633.1 cupin domain-containing protein [Desulforhopalus sp. IMCC35007]